MPDFKKAPPRPNPSLCSEERHLWPYGLSLAIYNRLGRLTKGGRDEFYGKVEHLAKYFDANKESTRRAFKRLVNAGWIEPLPQAGHYKWIRHDARAFLKNDCKKIEELPHWSLDADPFVGKIHGASGGRIRLMPNWIGVARKVASEGEFLAALREEFADGDGSPGTRFWNVVRKFRALKAKPTVENPASK